VPATCPTPLRFGAPAMPGLGGQESQDHDRRTTDERDRGPRRHHGAGAARPARRGGPRPGPRRRTVRGWQSRPRDRGAAGPVRGAQPASGRCQRCARSATAVPSC